MLLAVFFETVFAVTIPKMSVLLEVQENIFGLFDNLWLEVRVKVGEVQKLAIHRLVQAEQIRNDSDGLLFLVEGLEQVLILQE